MHRYDKNSLFISALALIQTKVKRLLWHKRNSSALTAVPGYTPLITQYI